MVMSYNQIEASKRSKHSLILDLKIILLGSIKELNGLVGVHHSKKIVSKVFNYLEGQMKMLNDIEVLSKTSPEQSSALNEVYLAKYIDQDNKLAKELFKIYKETYLLEAQY